MRRTPESHRDARSRCAFAETPFCTTRNRDMRVRNDEVLFRKITAAEAARYARHAPSTLGAFARGEYWKQSAHLVDPEDRMMCRRLTKSNRARACKVSSFSFVSTCTFLVHTLFSRFPLFRRECICRCILIAESYRVSSVFAQYNCRTALAKKI